MERLLGLWIALIGSLISLAAPDEKDGAAGEAALRRQVVRRYSTAEGLPQSTVTDIIEDADGYLWVSTFGGLARFDGLRFETWDIGSGQGLEANRFLSLLEDEPGRLWAGTEKNGVFVFEDGRFRAPPELGALAQQSVWDMVEGPDGALWLATGNGLYRLFSGRLERFGLSEGLPSEKVLSLLMDEQGRLWVGTLGGLARREGAGFIVLDRQLEVRSLVRSPEGEIHIGANGGIYRVEGDRLLRMLADDLWFNTLAWDPSGRLFASSDAGLSLLLDTAAVPIEIPGVDKPPLLRAMLADRAGNLWVGTNGQGLVLVQDPGFSRHRLPPDLSTEDVGPILEDREGTLWIGSSCGGLGRIRPGADRIEMVLPEICVYSLAEDRDGGLYIAEEDGIRLLRGEDEQRFGSADGLPARPVRTLLVDSSGVLWAGVLQAGLYRQEQGRFVPVAGLEDTTPLSLAEAPDGSMWIGTHRSLYRLHQGGLTRLGPEEGLPHGQVRDLRIDPDGVVWVGTYGGGLVRVKDDGITVFTTRQGLPDNTVTRILDDGQGGLWLNGNRGVQRILRSQLEAVARDPRHRIEATSWRTGEASPGQPAGWRSRDGRLWFPTIDGAVALDPAAARSMPAPSPRIELARLGGQPLFEGISLLQEERDLEIRYTAPHFLEPGQTRFRYRLVGRDDAWVEVGDQRMLSWKSLPPGQYRFELQARSIASDWSPEPVTLSFSLKPYLHERSAFPFLVLAGGFSMAAVVFQRRVRRVRARNTALRDEIEARRRVEADLREREDHYRTIFERAVNGFVILDAEGRVVQINETALRLLQIDRKQALAMPPGALVAPDSLDTWRALIARACQGEACQSEDVELLRRRGPFPVQLWMLPLVRAGSRHALVAFLDISDQRRLQAERRAMREQLQIAQKLDAVGQLAGGVAHDFNNLLTVMVSCAGLLEDSLDGEGKELAREIRQSGERGADLTRRLLAFGRRQVLRPEQLEVRSFLSELEPLLRASLRSGIQLQIEIEPGLPPIEVDRALLEQAILNLAFNARDAMPAGGLLRISARRDGPVGGEGPAPGVRLSVKDTGSGIEPEILPRIFEPFFTTRPPGEGSGLGLSSVHGFVRQSGGRITVDSTPGQGSTFHLHLPVAAGAEASPERLDPAPGPARSASILLCDDEEAVRRSTARILQRGGYAVKVADGPQSALRMAIQEPFDLLLTDVVMPGMKGTELAVEIRKKQPQVRVLFISGYHREPDVGEGSFLAKPFSAAQLLEEVAGLLQARSG